MEEMRAIEHHDNEVGISAEEHACVKGVEIHDIPRFHLQYVVLLHFFCFLYKYFELLNVCSTN